LVKQDRATIYSGSPPSCGANFCSDRWLHRPRWVGWPVRPLWTQLSTALDVTLIIRFLTWQRGSLIDEPGADEPMSQWWARKWWALWNSRQEAQLSPMDRAMHRVSWNLAYCHATVQKLLVRQVLNKSKLWSWRVTVDRCVINMCTQPWRDRVASIVHRCRKQTYVLRTELWISPV